MEGPYRRSRFALPPLLRKLLDRHIPVVVSTVSGSGRPQSSVVWIERRDDDLAMFFPSGSAKLRNLVRNPRLVVVAVDPTQLLAPGVPAYAQIAGTATIRPAEDDMPDRLARAYGQVDGFVGAVPDFRTVLMTVDRVTGKGPISGGDMGGWNTRPMEGT